MDVALLERIAEELGEHDARRELRLVGLHFFGDPLMHPQIVKMIEIVGSRVPNLRKLGELHDPMRGLGMSTNALLLSEDLVEPLLTSRLTWLGVAVDATSETTYRRMHGSERWELLGRNVERLLEANRERQRELPVIGLQYIESPETAGMVAQFHEMWSDHAESARNVETVVKPFTSWAGQVDDRLTTSPWHFTTPCLSPWEMLVVVSDGRVVPCCYDMDCSMTLGRLPDQTLQEVWEAEPLERLRERMLTGRLDDLVLCRNCEKARTYPFGRRR